MKKVFASPILILAFMLLPATNVNAVCTGSFIDLIGNIAWESIFPIKVAGITVVNSNLEDSPANISAPVCVCPSLVSPYFSIGLPVEFWEPSRLIETVKDPWCFPSTGINVVPNTTGAGTSRGLVDADDEFTFSQAHYIIFPVLEMLGLLTDFACKEIDGFDIGYLTPVDPLWNSDTMAYLINPEATLFGNPIAQLACIADSITANAGMPLDFMFWCMGSWGSAYPLTGSISNSNMMDAQAGTAARMIYKLTREFLIWDTAGGNLCMPSIPAIWTKSHFGLQIAMPKKGGGRVPIGRSSLLWGSLKNPPFFGDNFVFVLFKKRNCCARSN